MRLRLAPVLLTFCAPLTSQDAPAADRPFAERLAAFAAEQFRAATADRPGGVLLVARADDVLLAKAYGLADLERSVPLSTDSVLDIGSTSKQFTAACVLLLEQDGKLSLADPVKKHVPELPACCDPITLRHLVLHTSGLPDYIGLMMQKGVHLESRTSNEDAIDALCTIDALEFATGSKWSYSNSNYLLLSAVARRTSGVSLDAFAQERIFVPLGMRHTHVHEDCTQTVEHRALSYSRSPRGGWKWTFSNWEQTGDGAVMTTVHDLLRWARNFEHGTVGGPPLLAAMSRPGTLDGENGTPIDYGMGLMFGELDGRATVRHGGAWAAYRAELLRVPEAKLTIVCLCNRDDMNPSRIADRVASFVLAAGPR
jgi:CubicO group peptidase (beta-lactamase class C family)